MSKMSHEPRMTARKVWKVIKSSIKTVSIIILGKLANSLFIYPWLTLIHSAAQNITPLTQKLCKLAQKVNKRTKSSDKNLE